MPAIDRWVVAAAFAHVAERHRRAPRTIAEFVESHAILDRLRGLGVDFAQGYAVAPPVPIEELTGEEPALAPAAGARPRMRLVTG
jgi:EAL domain-containing protein (putative c-di-GMP-specific phosphodiesterase class I)